MRIGLTVEALSTELTGIGRYTWELCRGLQESPAITDLAYFDGAQWTRAAPQAGIIRRRPSRIKLVRKVQRWLSESHLRGRLVHGTNYFLPDAAEAGVVTVHDLSVLFYPESHPVERVRMFEEKFTRTMDRAGHVLTDCETVKRELVNFAGIPEQRITAVPLGVSAAFWPVPRERLTMALDRILGAGAGEYVLCVATFEPRKKIDAAIHAHLLFCERTGENIPLVLVGASGWKNQELHSVVETAQRRGRIIMPGYVSESDLRILYAGARLFVYPSIYEGFGLPPLEAMASGIPTIVANRSCMPEVTQGAAMLIDPDDIEGFSHAIEHGLHDEQWRMEAVDRGLKVAGGYKWMRCADETIEVYRRHFGSI
jgi:glycosyltransferase involved in cell wall biosynthesis